MNLAKLGFVALVMNPANPAKTWLSEWLLMNPAKLGKVQPG